MQRTLVYDDAGLTTRAVWMHPAGYDLQGAVISKRPSRRPFPLLRASSLASSLKLQVLCIAWL